MTRILAALLLAMVTPGWIGAESLATITLRGKDQQLHLYGSPDGSPVVVSSGDGGWIRLAVRVAESLGARGFYVVGVDSKSYLSSFTSGKKTLEPQDVPRDYKALVDYSRRGRPARVLLIGVSEGAGLSVLAASDAELQPSVAGVLGLGLSNENELGWRFSDSIIYLTKKAPPEPSFRAADYIPKLGSVPLAAIHSTHDEYVPLDEVRKLMALPGSPKRLWTIEAADHRFSNNAAELNQRLLEALEWIRRGGS